MVTKNFQRRFGFSAIELLIAMTIIAVLAALVIVGLTRSSGVARQQKCSAQLSQASALVHQYASDHRDLFPASVDDSGRIVFKGSASHLRLTLDPMSVSALSSAWHLPLIDDGLTGPFDPVLTCPSDRTRLQEIAAAESSGHRMVSTLNTSLSTACYLDPANLSATSPTLFQRYVVQRLGQVVFPAQKAGLVDGGPYHDADPVLTDNSSLNVAAMDGSVALRAINRAVSPVFPFAVPPPLLPAHRTVSAFMYTANGIAGTDW